MILIHNLRICARTVTWREKERVRDMSETVINNDAHKIYIFEEYLCANAYSHGLFV